MFWTLLGRRQPRVRTRQPRPKPVGPLECLEERLAPDASFFALATGSFQQNWSTTPIANDNDWSAVPSIVGYNGAGLATTPGTDPQTILADGTSTAVTVLSNQTDPSSLAPGGIAEFSTLSKPTVALAADSTDQAPFLLLNLNTTQMRDIQVSFNLRDLLPSSSTVAEPFALQYRIGTTGNFTNLATGSVPDATNGANPGDLVTPVNVTLPGDADNQSQLQVRIITTNPTDTARWIGVDDIKVTGVAAPLTFSIDSSNSSLTLSGDFGGNAIQQQGSGSLTTSYSGTIAAVWDQVANTISFQAAGSDGLAANSGMWSPAVGGGPGSALADYGLQVPVSIFTAQAALRDLHVVMTTNSPLSLSGSGPYTFNSTQSFTVTHGFADYNVPILGSGRADLSNSSAPNAASTSATLEDLGGGHYRLTLPIDVTLTTSVSGTTGHLRVQGTIVANATTPDASALPQVDLNGSNPGADNLVGFTQGGSAVTIAPNLTVTSSAATILNSAYITLTNKPDGTTESLDANVSGTNLQKIYDPNSGRLTITGSAALSVYQSVLRTVTYNNTASAANIHIDNRLIEFTVSDGNNFSSIRTAEVTIAATRSALVNTVPSAQSTAVDTPLTFSSAGGDAITVSDPNTLPVNTVQMLLTVNNGTLTLASTSGITIMAGDNGTSTITIRGSLSDINTALDGLVYTPGPEYSGSDTLTIESDDLRATDATGASHHQTTLSTVAISIM